MTGPASPLQGTRTAEKRDRAVRVTLLTWRTRTLRVYLFDLLRTLKLSFRIFSARPQSTTSSCAKDFLPGASKARIDRKGPPDRAREGRRARTAAKECLIVPPQIHDSSLGTLDPGDACSWLVRTRFPEQATDICRRCRCRIQQKPSSQSQTISRHQVPGLSKVILETNSAVKDAAPFLPPPK